MVDDVEKRLNLLFDALNCETLPDHVTDALVRITEGMSSLLRERRGRDADRPFCSQR